MNELFPRYQLGRVHQLVDTKRVSVPNGADATWSIDNEERVWVRKRVVNTGVEGLFAECVGSLLGAALGLRQPQGALFCDVEGWSWLSERIPGVFHWRPELRDRIANVENVAAMLALDAILINEDRHAGNILVEPSRNESVVLWAIDCGNALVGYPDDFSLARRAEVRNHVRGLPVTALRASALTVARRACTLTQRELRAYVEEAADVTQEPRWKEILEVLCSRCRSAVEIVSDHLETLERLS